LTARRHHITSDPQAFDELARHRGWSDGLPLVPPTEERVAAFLAATGANGDDVVTKLPPSDAPVTLEKIAANAVMAGAPAASLPLIVAALGAMSDPEFDLHGLNATTGSVVPAVIVNGPVCFDLDIPFDAGCLGGADGNAASIGRAMRLVMRNVAGQRVGVTSQSVYGTPGRVAGIVFGEWEERSPWKPLAERRGVPGDAVTVYGRWAPRTSATSSPIQDSVCSRSSGNHWHTPGQADSSHRRCSPRPSSRSTRSGPNGSPATSLTSTTSSRSCGSSPACPSAGSPQHTAVRSPPSTGSATAASTSCNHLSN